MRASSKRTATTVTSRLYAGAALLAATLVLGGCGGDPAADPTSAEPRNAAAVSTTPTTTSTVGPTTAESTSAPPTTATPPVDEIPALPGDGVNERLLPEENLLGRTGWSLAGESEDLTEPWYENPCRPASAVAEWSDPLSNVGRTWPVNGFNVPDLPASEGQIAVDLYGYGSPEDASEALGTVRDMVAGCDQTHPVGGVDTVVGDADLDSASRYPLDEGFILRTERGQLPAHVIIARQGQILLVTGYQAYSGDGSQLAYTALSEAVLSPAKETIGESF